MANNARARTKYAIPGATEQQEILQPEQEFISASEYVERGYEQVGPATDKALSWESICGTWRLVDGA